MNQENRQKVLDYCAEYDTYPLYFNEYESSKDEFNPEKYMGQNIKIKGKVMWVTDNKDFTMTVGDYTVMNDLVEVNSKNEYGNIYEDSVVVVYGTVCKSVDLFTIADAFVCNSWFDLVQQ